jgi:DNA ligase (NAD+)
LEVRGECVLFKEDFKELNETQEELGLPIFANPRNAAAGSLRQLDSAIPASRPLKFFGYALGAVEGFEVSLQKQIGDSLFDFGIPVSQKFKSLSLRTVCKTVEAVIDFYKSVEKIRSQLPYEIDGIVVKVNSLAIQEDLGLIARSPRWATAAKYKPEQVETKIEKIEIQVGRTGTLTPVAIMAPVKVGGVTITNATLHNQEEMERKDVRAGDTVIIHRAGDVIPEVVQVILEKRPKDSKKFIFPTKCPVCHEKVTRFENEIALRCVNSVCPAILKESLKHFASRRAMNIEKFGDRIVETLVDKKLISCFSDIYKLTEASLKELDRQGEKSSKNIIQSVEKSKNTNLAKFIHALGIRFVGEQTAKLLASHYKHIDAFLEAKEEDLLTVPEIGPKVAKAILDWNRTPKNRNEIQELLKCGIKFFVSGPILDGPLSGKSFLITGTLPVKRDEAQEWIEKRGGKLLSTVSAKLDYLVVGDDPGSKLLKAQSLGVKILSWDELKNFSQ